MKSKDVKDLVKVRNEECEEKILLMDNELTENEKEIEKKFEGFLNKFYPNYLKMVELTKGKLELNFIDKMNILEDFFDFYGVDWISFEKNDLMFKMFIDIDECKQIKDRKLKHKMTTDLIKKCVENQLGTKKTIEKIFKQPIDKYLRFTKMSQKSLKYNFYKYGEKETFKFEYIILNQIKKKFV